MATGTVQIKTNDDKLFTVDLKVSSQFGLVAQLVKDLENVDIIPLDQVNSKTFEIMLEYANYHKDDVLPEEPPEKRITDLTEHDLQLLDVHHTILLKVMQAANYLDYQQLVEVCARICAKRIMGKSVREIQKEFDIPEQAFRTPEEIMEMEQEVKNVFGDVW